MGQFAFIKGGMNLKRGFIYLGLVVAGLGLFGGGFWLARGWLGLPAPSLANASGAVGERGPVGLVFSQPVDEQSVEKAFRIDPAAAGHFAWGGNTLWWFPEQALAAGTEYKVYLAAGARSSDGRVSTRDASWTIKVRVPEIVYLAPAGQTANLWAQPAGGGAARQLSQGAAVYDYAVSSDGEQIAYSALNAEKGFDLWVEKRDGSQAQVAVECGSARCTNPSWRWDGGALAYSRIDVNAGAQNGSQTAHSQKMTPEPGVTPTGQPRIWTVNLDSGQAAPLYADPSIAGTNPLWSPDGSKLAFIDPGSGGVRIFRFDGSPDIFLPAITPVVGAWSADSTRLTFSDLDTAELPSFGAAYEVSFPGGQVMPLFASGPADADYNVPVPSPDGSWYAVGMRTSGGSPGRQLWLLSQDGSQQKALGSDFAVTQAAYNWSPDGDRLVFQQLALGSSQAAPEVWVWDSASSAFTRIAENATHPQWLP